MKNKHEFALQRRFGASPETRAKIEAANRVATNWYTRCPICGALLSGSLPELLAHTHEPG